MEITEVRIKLMESSEDRLRGFCSITFDGCFVVRDLKIIDGNSGPFVAMPSRKLTSNCSKCRSKNHMRANYCNHCGQRLRHSKPQQGADGRAKLYADIAHPINAGCREMIQKRVIQELDRELELAAKPGYRSRYDESYDGPQEIDEIDQRRLQNDQDSKNGSRVDSKHNDPSRPVKRDHNAKNRDSQ
jgi:stage V sporulation protein G